MMNDSPNRQTEARLHQQVKESELVVSDNNAPFENSSDYGVRGQGQYDMTSDNINNALFYDRSGSALQ